MTISEQIEQVREKMCNEYCKYTHQPPPEGKDEGWLYEDDSPCTMCPMTEL